MNIKFNNIHIYNFLSYKEAKIDLSNKGYCIIKGKNNNPKDNCLSNGVGKSTIINALCFALTGETIQGVSSDLKNLYTNITDCYVSLDFDVDGKNFKITRYKEPKSNLSIIVDGEDKSGKGLRDSEKILLELIPDLTSQLISSIILIGQGMPNKFTSFSPVERKNLLEKLSKSDYIINNLKSYISNRTSELKNSIINTNNKITEANTVILLKQKDLDKYNKEKETIISKDYKTLITDLENKNNIIKEDIDKNNIILNDLNNKSYTDNLSELTSKQTTLLEELDNKYKENLDNLKTEELNIKVDITSLEKEIKQLDNIKDICPTCGQKLPNIIKKDTNELKNKLFNLNENLNNNKNNYKEKLDAYNKEKKEINNSISKEIDNIKQLDKQLASDKTNYNNIINNLNIEFNNNVVEISNLKLEQSNNENLLNNIIKNIEEVNNIIESTNKELISLKEELNEQNKHQEVVNNINNLIKKDFRTFLLSNVVEFINKTIKEYCPYIFGTDELDFILNENNIEIIYCSKPFENLSGGEKQKCDIIIQFALRKLMSYYFNFSSNIIALDEIFDNLDRKSVDSVLNLISSTLNDLESIFIISHHDDLSIPYDNIIEIIKEKDGISSII